jgi:hypothetical protein
MEKSTLNIEVLESGQIRFKRGDAEQNSLLMSILRDLTSDENILKEFEIFFAGAEKILVLEGDEIFCG